MIRKDSKKMLDYEIDHLMGCYKKVLRPKTLPKIVENPLIIGMDSEFDKEGLISFSLGVGEGGYNIVFESFPVAEITPQGLFAMIGTLCRKAHIPIQKRIYLLSHFAQSELKHFEDLWRDLKIRVIHKSMYGTFWIDEYQIIVIDTLAHFLCSLSKIGESVGVPKLSLEGIGGKSEEYWKNNMRELFREYPKVFWEYAERDVEILLRAFHKQRDFLIDKFGLDILKCVTVAHTSLTLFRGHFLKYNLEPLEVDYYTRPYKYADGTWGVRFEKDYVYSGSRDKRYFAMKSYHGGRREAFFRGLINEDVEFWDVQSMYPTVAKMPLPNEKTKWVNTTKLEEILEGCGFLKCSFKFPRSTQYPCLPVVEGRFPKLVFPLEGLTWCTVEELKLALKLGAECTDLEAYVFYPTENEVKHPLKEFIEIFMEMKNKSKKNSVEYNLSKLMMNSLIGKFMQKDDSYNVEDTLELLRTIDYDFEELRDILSHQKRRQKYRRPIYVSEYWAPEWGSLILGRARAIIGDFMATSQAITGHTDSIVVFKGSPITCESLNLLRALGSDLIHEKQYDADQFWILRSAVYSPIKNGVHIKPTHHGYPTDKDSDFGDIIAENIRQGKSVINECFKTHLITPKEALRFGKVLGEEEVKTYKINWDWDFKRKLRHPDFLTDHRIWVDYTGTVPYQNIEFVINEYRNFKGLHKRKSPKRIKKNLTYADLPKYC